MLPMGAVINPADNSGARKLKIVGMARQQRRFACVGDVVTAVVRGAASDGTVKDHTLVKAIIVRTTKEHRRKDGSYIRFDDNAAVVIDKEGNMVGSRVFGPIAREIRDRGYLKIVSLAKEVL